MIVDAACCLPVFVIAAVTLLCLILQCGMEETVSYVLVQSARCSAKSAALFEAEDREGFRLRAAFLAAWEGFLLAEWGFDGPRTSLWKLSAGEEASLEGGSIRVDQLVRVRVAVENTRLPAPALASDPISFKNATFRPFVGESVQTEGADNTRVYVFPRRGERYHIRSCSILQNGQVQGILTDKIRRTYGACRLCHPDTLPNGAPVWLFSQQSHVYHRHTCASVVKNFVCMPRSAAVSAGYAPCQLCGGGHR